MNNAVSCQITYPPTFFSFAECVKAGEIKRDWISWFFGSCWLGSPMFVWL